MNRCEEWKPSQSASKIPFATHDAVTATVRRREAARNERCCILRTLCPEAPLSPNINRNSDTKGLRFLLFCDIIHLDNSN